MRIISLTCTTALALTLAGARADSHPRAQDGALSGELVQSDRGTFGVMARQSPREGFVSFEVLVRQGGGSSDRSLVAAGFVTEAECSSRAMRAVAQNYYRRNGSLAHTSILPGNPTHDGLYRSVIDRQCLGDPLRDDFGSLSEFLARAGRQE